MHDRTWIADLAADSRAVLYGWVRHRRTAGKLVFLEVRDGSGDVQAVVKRGAVDDAALERASSVGIESSVRIEGEVKAHPRRPGELEVTVHGFEVVGPTADDYPLGKKDHGAGFLFDQRHLWLRSSRPTAVLRVRARIVRALRSWLDERGFVGVDAPIFQSAAAEGTATLFPVEYFDSKVYLSQTGQLHMEAAAQALGRVYCFGPTFRAEKSKTRRHLTEFWMLEPEVAFATLDETMETMEELVAHVVEAVLADCRPALEALGRDVSRLEAVTAPFPRVSYDEALARLEKTDAALPWGEDFGAPQEDALSAQFDRPVLVHRFPAATKAFYMRPDPERAELALGVDMIAPEGYGEIIGGGERSGDLDFLLRRIREHGLPQEAYEWYLDLRRYGACPSAGFGLGLERVVAWICGLDHVREASPFPRTMRRTAP